MDERPQLDPRQWAYGKWWTAPNPDRPGFTPLDPQPPAPPQDASGSATGVPEGYEIAPTYPG